MTTTDDIQPEPNHDGTTRLGAGCTCCRRVRRQVRVLRREFRSLRRWTLAILIGSTVVSEALRLAGVSKATLLALLGG